jgi:hypothetical protein
MVVAARPSLPPSLLLSVPIVDVSVLLSDKQYTDPSVLGALAGFTKPVCPCFRLFLAFLDLRFRAGMLRCIEGVEA